ncbi:MAG: hypothetical protein R8K20_11730 [Gallionellaceae bacterium]
MGGSSSGTSSSQATTTNTTNENLQNLSGVDVIKSGGGDVTKTVNITDGGIVSDAFGFATAALDGVDKVSTNAIKTVAAATRSDAAAVMGRLTWVMVAGFVAVGVFAVWGKK